MFSVDRPTARAAGALGLLVLALAYAAQQLGFLAYRKGLKDAAARRPGPAN